MENYILFKNTEIKKNSKEIFEKHLKKYLVKGTSIYFVLKEQPTNFKKEDKVDEINITYNIERQNYKRVQNGIIYKILIKKSNMESIKEYLMDWGNNISIIYIVKDSKGILEIDFNENICKIGNFIFSKKQKIIFMILLFSIILVSIINSQFVITNKINCNKTIGIIDGNYTLRFENTIYNTNPKENITETHGDKMLKFANALSNGLNIYYYDATNLEGKIDTNNVILGLEYMKDNNIKTINISLSSKKYSSEIESWIKANPQIKVYASYNNLINSFDYPAMYEKVIGVGKKVDIEYKNIDKVYYNNRIIIIPNFSEVFEGNSYLSLYQMIKSN